MEQKQSCVVGQISILLQSVQYRYVLDIPEERVSAEWHENKIKTSQRLNGSTEYSDSAYTVLPLRLVYLGLSVILKLACC